MSARFLDDEARAAFARAIEHLEQRSAIEVVVAVRRRSAGYFHANALVGAIVWFAALAAMLYAEELFGLMSILVDPLVVGTIAGVAVHWLSPIKRLLTPQAMRDRLVMQAARATFVERGVHRTRDRSGVLVYISWLEQQVVVLGDAGAERALGNDALAQAGRTLTAQMARGGAAVARALGELFPVAGDAMPRRADDVNELPDAISSDLRRRPPR